LNAIRYNHGFGEQQQTKTREQPSRAVSRKERKFAQELIAFVPRASQISGAGALKFAPELIALVQRASQISGSDALKLPQNPP
jgi:hypothetical protein